MRAAVLVLLTACATEHAAYDPPDPFAEIWTSAMRPGDLIVAVPGTSSYPMLGAKVDAADGAELEGTVIEGGADVLEGAVAAARRAGLDPTATELGIWGAGITKATAFRYHSLDGAHVTFHVLGGTSVCANGGIADNLKNYNQTGADTDATDLYKRLQAYLMASPGAGRNVTLVSHSWGGLAAEYFATHLATLTQTYGALPGADVAFVISAGVPPFVPGYQPPGPGFRTYESTAGDVHVAPAMYEVDRPDDPAHSFDLADEGGGHHYIIRVGTQYLGWYGITTDELACAGVAGPCPMR